MTRAKSIAAIVAGALAWAATTACNQQTIQTPTRSFDRPSDVALTCVQYFENDISEATPHGTYNVRPLSDCETVRANELAIPVSYPLPINFIPPLGPGNFVPFLVALVPQSARGELALVDTEQNKLIDLDPYTPDYGFVPVGKLPEHIRASSDGCVAVTSNTDSCNLSRVDVSTVLHAALLSLFPEQTANTIDAKGVTNLPFTVPSATAGAPPKRLFSRPAWIEMAPANDAGGSPAEHGYEGDGSHDGFCKGGTHNAWVALPACGLVVKVSLEAGDDPTQPTIQQALRVDGNGVAPVTDLSTIDCPIECTDESGVATASDLSAPTGPTDMGSIPSNLPSGPYPAAIAIDTEPDAKGNATTGRIIIGDGYGERIDMVPFDVKSATFGTPTAVTLEPPDNGITQQGVRVLRIGPRGEAGKFLYAVARDGTVRVIDLDRTVECETNPDPRWKSPTLNLQQTPTFDPASGNWLTLNPNPRTLGCFPLGDPSTPRRSPFATSPGIQLAQGQIPTDVAFVHVDAPPGDPTQTTAPPAAAPGLLVGDFAWIITSNGQGTVVDIWDACPQPNQQPLNAESGNYTRACIPQNVQQSIKDTVIQFGHPQAMLNDLISHQVRSGHPRFFLPTAESDATGMPRVPDHTNPCGVAVPSTSPGVPDGGVPDAGGCGSNMGNLPSLYVEPVPSELLSSTQQGETRAIYFTDPDHARNENWVLTWEGVLPGSDRSTGAAFVVGGDPTGTDFGGYVSDPGGAWCSRGVLAGDKLLFRGCTVDSECDNAGGFQCVHDPGAFLDVTQGMCLHIDNKMYTVDYWAHQCGKLLRSQRKYRVLSARQGAPVPQSGTGGMTTPVGGSTTDLLKVGEIYEPEYPQETHTCDPNWMKVPGTPDPCMDIKITTQFNPQSRSTQCLQDFDGQFRCLASCTDASNDNECGADFECAPSQFTTDPNHPDLRCMRAPLFNNSPTFWQTCMPELQQYEVHVGDAFTIEGTSSGYLSNEVANDGKADPSKLGECEVPPETLERVRLAQWRIPLDPPACTPDVDAEPLATSIDPAVLPSNICKVNALNESTTRLIHFENPIFNIVLQLPLNGSKQPFIPPDNTSVSLGITGGGSNLVSLLGVDVQAQQPRYAVVAPDGQTVYVVDEGKSPLATGLRGQLLRLFSTSQSIDTTFIVR
ncbi:MAG TPA: hypothetical protein VN947_12650 [Polyangia bacterium]|nr:hypothetical protein [Polyangia bacterium]